MTTYVISGGETLNGTTVTGGGAVSSIVLAAGDIVSVTSGGTVENITLTGETLSIANNASGSNIVVSNGGVAILGGGAFVSGITVLSGGVLSASGANLTGAVINSGGILKQPSGILTNPVSLAAGADIIFTGTGSSVTYTSGFSGNNEQITVTSNSGTRASETVTLLGSGYVFSATTSGVKPELMVTAAPCYAGGTTILTEHGAVAVEAIQKNDNVVVRRDGRDVLEPVIWVGSSTIDLTRHAHPERAAPIRVKAGALADNTPAQDLVVSPEHCLIIDGRCVPAKLLVNGGSIIREYRDEPFIYYHLELERHGILIAQGAEAESYLETGNRAAFDHVDLPGMLHPSFAVNATSDRWINDACAPLATMQQEVVPIWQALADRSATLGFVVPEAAGIADADLHILLDGKRVQPISQRDSRYVFAVPAGVGSVSLMSRSFIPADKLVAAERDTRRLGVRVDWLAIRSDGHETIVSADNPALRGGWYEVENADTVMWRWTDGAATIPWDDVVGAAVLTICCTPGDWYPAAQDAIRLVA